MDIDKLLKEKEGQFKELDANKERLQNDLQEIHNEQLRLQGEYRVLQKLKEDNKSEE